jgi:exopolysaccharide biosynthesis polyprenyl glycosylphosphotransferase
MNRFSTRMLSQPARAAMSAPTVAAGPDVVQLPEIVRESTQSPQMRPTLIRRRRRSAHRLLESVPPLLLLADAVAFTACVVVAYRRPLGAEPFGVLTMAALTVVLFRFSGLYRPRLHLSVLDDAPILLTRAFTAAGLVALGDAAIGRHSLGWSLLKTAAAFCVVVVAVRAVAYAGVRTVRRRRVVAHRTLIVGAGQVGTRLGNLLDQHSEYGLLPVGLYDPDPLLPDGQQVPVITDGTLGDAIFDTDAAIVVVAFSSDSESEIVNIVRSCDRMRCEIFLVPRLFEMHSINRGMDAVWGIPLIRLSRPPLGSNRFRLKRIFDFCASLVALMVLIPVLAVVALLVRIDDGPGILFSQERIGRGGRAFRLWKFRTVPSSAGAASATRWSVSDDPQLSRIARFLRRTSLDELPQLWNVLRGDMSLVGPRPERPYFVDDFQGRFPRYLDRHRVPVGLTGLAQINGLRGDTSIEDRARFDNAYIESWSMWGDLKILLHTVGAVVRRSGG